MNYEKFNDAMCRLRQAEENLNKSLQDVADVINEVERKPQKFQENNDKDLHKALHIIAAEDGMSVSELNDAFGICSVCDILLEFTPEEIIDKINQWRAKKEQKDQELHVGDEILVVNSDAKLNNRTFVIYEIDDNCYYVIDPITLYKDGFFKNAYIENQIKKTGKHYDSIPLKKEDSNKRNEYRDQEFHVGDEVKHEHGRKGIITSIDDKTLWITYKSANGFGFDYCWVPKDTSEKTGRHFDKIPFGYNPEKDD